MVISEKTSNLIISLIRDYKMEPYYLTTLFGISPKLAAEVAENSGYTLFQKGRPKTACPTLAKPQKELAVKLYVLGYSLPAIYKLMKGVNINSLCAFFLEVNDDKYLKESRFGNKICIICDEPFVWVGTPRHTCNVCLSRSIKSTQGD